MKVRILGTRGEIKSKSPYHKRHSGILIDNRFLFDLGEEEFLDYQPEYIFITHLHPDHAFFVKKKSTIENLVYTPEKCKQSIKYKVFVMPGKFGSYKIIPIPTIHSLKVKSQAYLIIRKHEKILYTGDMIAIDKKYYPYLKNLDLVITEASFIRSKGLVRVDKVTGEIFGHAGIPDLMQLFSQFTKHILFIHFGTWFYKNPKLARKKIQFLAKEYNLVTHIGYDGMNIDSKELI